MQEPIPSHSEVEREEFVVNYPDHIQRSSSPEYTKTHKKLCVELNLPCWVCGKNRPEVQTESHHFFCEWADQTAVDWNRFAEFIKKFPNPQTGELFADKFSWDEVQKNPTLFVDSVYNMIILCEEHHRDKVKGIHHVPFPNWIVQSFPLSGFVFLEPEKF